MILTSESRILLSEFGVSKIKGNEQYLDYYVQTEDDENYSYAYLYNAIKEQQIPGHLFIKLLIKKDTPNSHNWLGFCYGDGFCVEKNAFTSIQYYVKSAEKNCKVAQYNLGNCYLRGHGIAKDMAKAFSLFKSSAEQGYAFAQYSVGKCYRFGHGVAPNLTEAVKYFKLSAKQGYELAFTSLKYVHRIIEQQSSKVFQSAELHVEYVQHVIQNSSNVAEPVFPREELNIQNIAEPVFPREELNIAEPMPREEPHINPNIAEPMPREIIPNIAEPMPREELNIQNVPNAEPRANLKSSFKDAIKYLLTKMLELMLFIRQIVI